MKSSTTEYEYWSSAYSCAGQSEIIPASNLSDGGGEAPSMRYSTGDSGPVP